jgi:uncharacterized protein YaaR (DUF327 family)
MHKRPHKAQRNRRSGDEPRPMARIDSLGEAAAYHVPEKKRTQKKEKTPKSFSGMVKEAEESNELSSDLTDSKHKRTLAELLDGVFDSGRRLKELPTLDRVKEYKQKVKEFVKYAVSRMLAVKETTSGANILKRKRFTLVEVIDRQLEALAMSVLSAQHDQMEILAQVDEINGLLVDLVS